MLRDPANTPRHPVRWRLFPAVAIIAIGVLFLLNNLGYPLDFPTRGNDWALFIYIGALAPLNYAYEAYRADGRFTAEVAGSLLGAAAVVLVGTMFLLGLDWTVWWPLFVILGGLFTLLRGPYCCGYGGYRRRRYWRRQWNDHDDATIKH